MRGDRRPHDPLIALDGHYGVETNIDRVKLDRCESGSAGNVHDAIEAHVLHS
jgi:hypothetical protein